jgi:hypothetical protein
MLLEIGLAHLYFFSCPCSISYWNSHIFSEFLFISAAINTITVNNDFVFNNVLKNISTDELHAYIPFRHFVKELPGWNMFIFVWGV